MSFLFREEAITKGESGAQSIVPGKPQSSEVIRRLTLEDDDLRMPLDHPPLNQEEIDLLKRWIREGAEWEDHWAYTLPKMPELPDSYPSWVSNPIDHFVLNKLNAQQFSPSPEAAPEILLRRIFLDLIGLPPSEEDYEKFLSFDQLPIDEVLEQCLNDTAFGEKWASFWLDLARYADSQGYEKDPYRSIWKYRTWVIDALNEDMPFDQFTIEQLAGDLLPNPTEEQLIATAFHRNTMTNTEGGTDDEEFRVAAMIDRVNTTFEVWQATTMACVQCHSHPYDPFRHEEYYQFYAILNSTKDNDLSTEHPLLESYETPHKEFIQSQIEFIQNLKNESLDTTLRLSEQIEHALRPTLYMSDADELENAILYHNGLLTNWGNNVNDAIDRKFYFRFADISLDNLESLVYHYKAETDDVRMDIYLDSDIW